MSKKPSLLPGLLALLMGLVGILVVIASIETSQNLTSQAEDATKPTISVKTNPSNPRPFETLNIEFQINTKNRQVATLDMTNIKMSGKTWATLPSKLDTAPAPELSAITNSIKSLTSTTAQIDYTAGLADTNQPFNTGNEPKTFARFSYVPQSAGTLLIDFDPQSIIVTEYGGTSTNIANDPQDVKIAIGAITSSPAPDNGCLPAIPSGVKASTGTNPGEIRLYWASSPGAEHYALSFGPQAGLYQWGATDVGNVREFIIRQLTPGKRYYIVVSAVNSCGGSAYSKQVSAIAKGTTVISKGGQPVTIPQASYKPEIVIYNPPEATVSASPSATPSATPTVPPRSPEPSEGRSGAKKPFLKTLLILLGVILGVLLLSRLIKIRKVDEKPTPPPPNPEPSEPASPAGGPTSLIQEPPLEVPHHGEPV